MPYKVEKSGGGYKVVEQAGGKHPGKTFSKKPLSKAKAAAQLKAIYMHTKEGSK